jgi:hypothetical protein
LLLKCNSAMLPRLVSSNHPASAYSTLK